MAKNGSPYPTVSSNAMTTWLAIGCIESGTNVSENRYESNISLNKGYNYPVIVLYVVIESSEAENFFFCCFDSVFGDYPRNYKQHLITHSTTRDPILLISS